MGRYFYVVNHDKQEKLDPQQMGEGNKFVDFVPGNGRTLTIMSMLLSCTPPILPLPCAVREHVVGRWAGDRVEILGTGDPGYAEAASDYADVPAICLQAFGQGDEPITDWCGVCHKFTAHEPSPVGYARCRSCGHETGARAKPSAEDASRVLDAAQAVRDADTGEEPMILDSDKAGEEPDVIVGHWGVPEDVFLEQPHLDMSRQAMEAGGIYMFSAGGKASIGLQADGRIFVNGKLVDNDKQVVDGMRDLLGHITSDMAGQEYPNRMDLVSDHKVSLRFVQVSRKEPVAQIFVEGREAENPHEVLGALERFMRNLGANEGTRQQVMETAEVALVALFQDKTLFPDEPEPEPEPEED
jgi:hypothetical protein